MLSHLPATILAGGRSSRMGTDKALTMLAGRPLLAHVLDALRPQTSAILLNTNADPARFAAFGLEIAADVLPGQPGPLAGLLTAMEWAHALGAHRVLTVSIDTPFLAADLAIRLAAAGPDTVIAASKGRLHPTIGLHPTALAPALRAALNAGTRRVTDWLASVGFATAAFPHTTQDPFLNINTPAELSVAQGLLTPD